MAGKRPFGNPVPVSDLAAALLDPLLRKRTGISIGLIQSWEEIVGPRLAGRSRPEKLQWPRRASEDDPFKPATLVIACEGAAALHLQHETGEVIGRVNGFLGFNAVDRIRIVQKPIASLEKPVRPKPRGLSSVERGALEGQLRPIEDEGLRAALERLGASIVGSKKS